MTKSKQTTTNLLIKTLYTDEPGGIPLHNIERYWVRRDCGCCDVCVEVRYVSGATEKFDGEIARRLLVFLGDKEAKQFEQESDGGTQ